MSQVVTKLSQQALKQQTMRPLQDYQLLPHRYKQINKQTRNKNKQTHTHIWLSSLTARRKLFIKSALSTCFLLVKSFCCALNLKNMKFVCNILLHGYFHAKHTLTTHTHTHTRIHIIYIKDIYFCVIVLGI